MLYHDILNSIDETNGSIDPDVVGYNLLQSVVRSNCFLEHNQKKFSFLNISVLHHVGPEYLRFNTIYMKKTHAATIDNLHLFSQSSPPSLGLHNESVNHPITSFSVSKQSRTNC